MSTPSNDEGERFCQAKQAPTDDIECLANDIGINLRSAYEMLYQSQDELSHMQQDLVYASMELIKLATDYTERMLRCAQRERGISLEVLPHPLQAAE